MEGLQQVPDLLLQCLVVIGEDDGVVADPVGGVLLQQDVAQTHGGHPAVAVGVAGEDPHIAVVPGDELLEDHVVLIAGGVDVVQAFQQLLPALADVHLGQGVVAAGPVSHAVSGLGDVGRAPGEGEVMAHGFVIDKGGRVVDAVLVAQLVEFFLVDEGIQQLPADIGGDYVFRQGVPAVSGQLDVAVSAAQDKDCFAGKFPRYGLNIAAESFLRLVV